MKEVILLCDYELANVFINVGKDFYPATKT